MKQDNLQGDALEKASETEEETQIDEALSYKNANIDPRILRAVEELGFEQMTPIQAQAIPILLEGKDVLGQAQTGTGKTAAFGIPVIQKIDLENHNLQTIILCPTRELAIQAAEDIRHYAKFMSGIKVLPIYGGQDITKQIRSLRGDVQIVVGTPGRVMDHMRRHTLRLDSIKMVVLDEADEMLNMGFREDIETILRDIPSEHQTALFSATMPKPILDITSIYQHDAVRLQTAKKELTIPLVKQYYYEVKNSNKEEVVCRLLDYYDPKLTLIFCNTKRMVDELSNNLKGRGYFAEGLHGDLSQNQRDKVMSGFRSGVVEILIATDVAARGIDVDNVEAVFNYDIPQDIEYYVHRIGRTGRAGRKGRSFTFVSGREIYKIREIEQTCKTKIKARTVPSAEDITTTKAEKFLGKALDAIHENNLEKMIHIVEAKLDEEDCTAIELAAAFLKEQMGEEIKDIPVEKYVSGGDRGGRGSKRYSDDRRGGRSERVGERSGKSYKGSRDNDKKHYKRDDTGSYRRDDDKKHYKTDDVKSYSRDDREKRHYKSDDVKSVNNDVDKKKHYKDVDKNGNGVKRYKEDDKKKHYKDSERSEGGSRHYKDEDKKRFKDVDNHGNGVEHSKDDSRKSKFFKGNDRTKEDDRRKDKKKQD